MTYDPKKHHRRSIRLKGYDYSQAGAYFVTICVHGGQPLLGTIKDGRMLQNPNGALAEHAWFDLPNHYPHVELDAFVVMPNHVHGIIVLTDVDVGAGLKPAPTTKRHGLSEIVRAFKTFSARRINKLRDATGNRFWQRNYYEHIVRNDMALDRIRQYIANNPAKWHNDKLHPSATQNQFNADWDDSK